MSSLAPIAAGVRERRRALERRVIHDDIGARDWLTRLQGGDAGHARAVGHEGLQRLQPSDNHGQSAQLSGPAHCCRPLHVSQVP